MQTLLASLLAALLQVPPPPVPLPAASPTPVTSPTPAAQLSAQPAVADHLYPGSTLSIAMANSTAPITVSIDNPIVTWTIDQNAHTVTLMAGQTLGRAVLTIADASSQTLAIPVRVGVDAAKVAANSLTLQYTGNPVDQAWLEKTVQRTLLRNVQAQPGITAQTSFNLPAALAPGSVSAFDAQVTVPGSDTLYPVNAVVNVNLQNVPAPAFAPPLLFYDDDPEHIPAEGVLFKGHVSPGTPVRLYYYHDNGGAPRDLAVVLTANGTSSVQLIDASAGPNIDVMTVGHNVTRDFLTRKPANQGIVATVNPDAPYVAERVAMKPLDGAAGSIDLNILSGSAVDVTVLSVAPGTPDAQLSQLLGQPHLPGDGHHRTGIFNLAGYANDSLSYTVGGEDASIDYGLHSPPTVQPADGRDFGEYGVWRTLSFAVNNPTGTAATLYLYEQPMGGPVRSSFIVNNAQPPVQVGCARASERYQIGDPIQAPPGSSTVQLQTMTDGGSFYPLEVGLTATPPSPSPPPISAPNGCFPKAQAPTTPAASPQPEPTGR